MITITLEDFDEEYIMQYAANVLGMVYQEELFDIEDRPELEPEDLRTSMAFEKLPENLHRINVEDLEKLTEEF